MSEERRAFARQTASYRLGHFLVRLSERRSTRIVLSLALGVTAGILEVIAHESFTTSIRWKQVAVMGDAFIVASFVFLLTYVELSVVRERRLRVARDVKTLADLNHHIRNALEAIQYAAYTSSDKTNLELIDASIDRIDHILHGLYPTLEISPDLHKNVTARRIK